MENKETMYHIALSKKDIQGAKYAILAGDPGRIPKIAGCLNNPVKLKVNREYTSYLGDLAGEKVLAISHGIGGPSTAICVEELAQIGIKYLIYVFSISIIYSLSKSNFNLHEYEFTSENNVVINNK